MLRDVLFKGTSIKSIVKYKIESLNLLSSSRKRGLQILYNLPGVPIR